MVSLGTAILRQRVMPARQKNPLNATNPGFVVVQQLVTGSVPSRQVRTGAVCLERVNYYYFHSTLPSYLLPGSPETPSNLNLAAQLDHRIVGQVQIVSG